jgi:hypothetical protein
MKKYITIILTVLIAAVGCEEVNQTLSPNLYNASFAGSGVTLGESNVESYVIPIKLTASAQSSDTQVTLSVSGTGVEGKDYSLITSAVTIPAGEFFTNAEIELLDDFEEDGEKTIVLEIVSVSNGLKAGLDGTVGNKYTLTIADNDCAFDINEFVGSYDVKLNNAAAFLYSAGVVCCLETTLSLGSEPNTLIDSDFYGLVSGGLASANPAVSIKFNNADLSNITVALDPSPQFGYLSGANGRQHEQQPGNLGSAFTCDKKFTVNFLIRRLNGLTIAQTATLTYTKK